MNINKALQERDWAIESAEKNYILKVKNIDDKIKKIQQNHTASDQECTLCCDGLANLVIYPCLHTICDKCSVKIDSLCPWDRSPILRVL